MYFNRELNSKPLRLELQMVFFKLWCFAPKLLCFTFMFVYRRSLIQTLSEVPQHDTKYYKAKYQGQNEKECENYHRPFINSMHLRASFLSLNFTKITPCGLFSQSCKKQTSISTTNVNRQLEVTIYVSLSQLICIAPT